MTSNIPVIELFIKGSPTDKEEKGACPLSQKWFMAFFSLVERGYADLRITTVSPQNPPKSFTALGASRKLPVALVLEGSDPLNGEDMAGHVADTDDEIEALLNRFNCPEMSVTVSDSYKVVQDVYSYFNRFLMDNNPSPMLQCLKKLDGYLSSNGTKFLDGDELHFNDCIIMPKLQHIRVACKSFKNFDIPFEYDGLWTYMKTMYETSSFRASCPADCDILGQYLEKVQPPPPEFSNKRISLSSRQSTFHLPQEISNKLGAVMEIDTNQEIYEQTNQKRRSQTKESRYNSENRNSTNDYSFLPEKSHSSIPNHEPMLANTDDENRYEHNYNSEYQDSAFLPEESEPIQYRQSSAPATNDAEFTSLYTYSYHDYTDKPQIARIAKSGNDSDID